MIVENVDRGSTGDLAVDAAVLSRDRTLDHADVLTRVLFHRLVQGILDLITRRGEQCLVVIQRDEVEDQLRDTGCRGAEQRLRTPGALLEVEPDHRRFEACLSCLRPFQSRARGKTYGGGCHHAALDKVPSADSLLVRGTVGHT